MKKSNIHYKEIQGRYLYILEDEGKAVLTAGTPENHTHVELTPCKALRLRNWLDKFIERKVMKSRKKLGLLRP